VQIARYIREISTPADTLYAAHEFPVLAFYSERKTKSLLPIQDDFDRTWHDWMKDPGYVVYYRPSGIRETHSKNPSFKPDLSFMDARPTSASRGSSRRPLSTVTIPDRQGTGPSSPRC